MIDSSKLTRYEEDGNWNLTKTFDETYGAWNPPSTRERLTQFEQKASEQEQKLRILEDERDMLASEVAQKTNTINEQEEKLQRLTSEHLALVARFDEIIHSLGYKFMRFYGSRIDRLFPDKTRRGELRKIITRTVGIATEQGPRVLLRFTLKKIRRRELRSLDLSHKN